MERLNEFDVLAAPVNDIEGILKDPRVQQRGSVVSIPDPVLGDTVVQEVVPASAMPQAKSIGWAGTKLAPTRWNSW